MYHLFALLEHKEYHFQFTLKMDISSIPSRQSNLKERSNFDLKVSLYIKTIKLILFYS